MSNQMTSVKLTTSNGPLAQVWLAANMSNLSKGTVLQTNISDSVKEIVKVSGYSNEDEENSNVSSVEHITLRTSGELLHGIVRVYSKQAAFLLNDIKDALLKISSLFKSNQRISVTLSKENTVAKINQLILEDAVTEKEVLSMPELDFLNDQFLPEGLLNFHNNSMQRKVVGVSTITNNNNDDQWDNSIELGRRFNPDDEAERNHSSTLNLDFDLDESHKDWEEGTNSLTNQQQSNILTELDSNRKLINDDDDFPMDDEVDWDLGFSENMQNENNDNNPNSSVASVEVGRRAEIALPEEPTDFGFELDLGKDVTNEVQEELITEEPKEVLENTHEFNITNKQKKSDLANAKKLIEDNDTELSDEQVKRNDADDIVTNEKANYENSVTETKLSQKRLMEDLNQSINFLPQAVVENFFQYNCNKRQKLDTFVNIEPEMNLSFNNDDIIAGSGIDDDFDGINGDDNDENDHFMPIESDVGIPPIEDDFVKQNENANIEKVKLKSGEVVSKATADMAELLRSQFVDTETIKFDTILSLQNKDVETTSQQPVTKSTASKAFFEMLTLATADCIAISQKKAFETINITSKASLFEQFMDI